jgi:thiol-disulfide isomerase/thioredoxin
MRALVLACVVSLAVGCAPKNAPSAPAAKAGTAAPAATPVAAPAPLLGHVTRAQLKAYAPWALFWEEVYRPDPAAVLSIKQNAKDLYILLVMGTWCPDSKRELPRYFATMDAAGIDDSRLTMIGVDRTKKDTEGLTDKWDITRVPTFVFLRNGREVGRFVERTPTDSTFEAEMAKILRGGRPGASSR